MGTANGNGTLAPRAPRSTAIIDRKLRRRLGLRILLMAILLGALTVRVIQGDVAVGWAALAVAAGALFGLLFSRSTALAWDAESGTVSAGIDALGVLVLALQLGFVLLKGRLVGAWVPDAIAVAAIGVGMTGGCMVGQVLGTLRGIRGVLASVDPPPERSDSWL